MIAKLEWTQSNAQQNLEQLQNLKMEVTINNNKNNKSPPLQFNNNITLHIVSLHRNTDIKLGQYKQQK